MSAAQATKSTFDHPTDVNPQCDIAIIQAILAQAAIKTLIKRITNRPSPARTGC